MSNSVTDQVADVVKWVEEEAAYAFDLKNTSQRDQLNRAARLIATLAAEVDAWRNAELDDCGAGAEANAGYCLLAASQLATDALLAEVSRG